MSFEEFGLNFQEPVDGIYRSRAGLNYTYLFYYEKKFFNDEYVESKRTWMSRNWHLSIYYACIYMAAIYFGRYLMKSRDKFDLRGPLVAWNFVLAAFSLVGALRTWPEFIHTLFTKGIEHTICNNDYTHGVSGCWAWLFILSKVPELIDTVFIVLRKQELIFLHWYHHATVLIYCWFACSEFSSSGRWFVLMNYTVHAAMYAYYGFRALRFRIPKWVNMVITSGQISQMVFGIYVNIVGYMKKQRGEQCAISDDNIKWSFIMYFSYFLLFFNFFYYAYISPPKKTIKKSDDNGKPVEYTNGHVKQNGNGVASNGNGTTAHYDVNNNNDKKKTS